MLWTLATFVGFTVLVAVISYFKTKGDDQETTEGVFPGEARPAGAGHCRFAAADQPVRRAAGRLQRPDLRGRHERDGV